MKFTTAAKKFFELKDGETLSEFVVELKGLTQEDREELAPLLAVELGQPVELN